ncbi:MAG: GNAT family N-acetyltransferase [Anaerolineae bacterium]|nr:GNAT family N-acetyltransferase [Anaerolineae bacterium]
MRCLYADTAFFGEPVEAYFDDRKLFADLGVSLYLDHYPDYAFVARQVTGDRLQVTGDRLQGVAHGTERGPSSPCPLSPVPCNLSPVTCNLSGYIVGSPHGDADVHRHLMAHLPAIVGRLVRGRYRLGRKTMLYYLDNALAWLRGQLLEIRDPAYPANLHINVASSHRGQGLGWELLSAYLEHLQRCGVPGVHAVTTDHSRGAVRLFQKAGFRLLEEKSTSVWRRHLGRQVRLLGFGLRLDQDGPPPRRPS